MKGEFEQACDVHYGGRRRILTDTGFPISPLYIPKDRGPGQFIDLANAMHAPPLAVRNWNGFQLQRYVFPSSHWTHDPIGHVRLSIQIGGASRMDRRLAGKREMEVRGPGTISITPPGEGAAWRWQDPMDVILVFLPGNVISEVASDSGSVDIASIALQAPLAAGDGLLTEAAKVLMQEESGPLQEMMAATAVRFMAAHLLNAYGRASFRRATAKGGLSPSQLKKVLEFMRDRLADDLQLSDLAAVAGLSPSHFCRAFKASIGMPPHRWQVVQRMEYAKKLLSREDIELSGVAHRCGYTEQSNFNKAFKRVTGATPGSWRRDRTG